MATWFAENLDLVIHIVFIYIADIMVFGITLFFIRTNKIWT